MFGIFKKLSENSNLPVIEALKNGAYLIDVRSGGEFASGSVQGAVNIPVDQITAHINTLKKKQNIIVFCRSGNRSGMAKSILQQNGISNVINGGTWQNVKKLKDTHGK